MTDPHEYPELEASMKEVGDVMLHVFKESRENLGFALFVFHMGEGGGMAYMSNAKREDMILAIKEWLTKQGQVTEQ